MNPNLVQEGADPDKADGARRWGGGPQVTRALHGGRVGCVARVLNPPGALTVPQHESQVARGGQIDARRADEARRLGPAEREQLLVRGPASTPAGHRASRPRPPVPSRAELRLIQDSSPKGRPRIQHWAEARDLTRHVVNDEKTARHRGFDLTATSEILDVSWAEHLSLGKRYIFEIKSARITSS